jgi:phospholipase/carboxylesterase
MPEALPAPLEDAIVVQRPAAAAEQLVLLFHGVGADADDLLPLGLRLAQRFARAMVVSVAAPEASDVGLGRQWFSVQGVSDAQRVQRVQAAMPAFVATVHAWQRASGVSAEATALVGFSQGAIMALESTRGARLAARVVGIAGRYAQLPEAAPEAVTIHLLHGKTDGVIHYGNAVAAAERLVALGGDVTADVLPFVGHELPDEMIDLLIERLTTHVPRRLWDEAMRAAPATAGKSRPG